jgi:thymidylate synthase
MTTPYLETISSVYHNARDYQDRTGKGRRRQFGAFERYDLRNNTLPADTTTQLFLKTLTREILGFIKGSTKIEDLGVHFWRKWSPTEQDIDAYVERIKQAAIDSDDEAYKEFFKNEDYVKSMKEGLSEYIDTIGPMYGAMWRNFPRVNKFPLDWVKSVDDIPSDKIAKYKEYFAAQIVMGQCPERNTKEEFERFALGMFNQTFDQLAMVMKGLKEKPYSSRHRITAFHPDTVGSEDKTPIENVLSGKAALTPCHSSIQFMVTDREDEQGELKKVLNCMFYMSSSDVMIGRPYNVCQYAIMTILMAHCLDMEPGELIIVSCDTHIYLNHLDKVPEQLSRVPLPYPTITLPKDKKDLYAFTVEDIVINDYKHHPKIVYEVAV